MDETVRKLWSLLEPRERRRLVRLVAVVAFGSLLEAVGIGLILPYLRIVTGPSRFFEHEVGREVLAATGINSSEGLMIAASGVIVGLYLLKNLYLAYQWRAAYRFLYDQTVELSGRLLRGYLRAPYTFHLERNTAELVRNTTTESRRVFDGAVRSALELAAELLVAAGLVAVLLVAHAAAAAVVLVVLGLFGWGLTAAYRSRLRRVGSARAEHQSRIIQAVNESLGALKEVKLLGREGSFEEAFRASAAELAEAFRQEAVVRKYPRLVLETGAVVAMIGLAAIVVFTGTTVIAAVPVAGVFGVALVRLMPSLNRVVDNLNQLRYEAPAIDIVHRELDRVRRWDEVERPGEREPSRLPFRERLEVEDVQYRYAEEGAAALKGVSFDVSRGAMVGLVGPSGSGKTTLVNLLLGLLEPEGGEIRVDGIRIRENRAGWQRQVGYVPQDVYLTDDSVARNVAFGLRPAEIDEDRVREALRLAQAGEFVASLSEGVHTEVGERGVRVSGGQRQRIALARALYHDPTVVVLDEATSSLDYETERRVMEAVEGLAGEKTLVVVTHRLRTVRGCDAVYLLEEGELIATGSYGELVEESQRFQQLALEG